MLPARYDDDDDDDDDMTDTYICVRVWDVLLPGQKMKIALTNYLATPIDG